MRMSCVMRRGRVGAAHVPLYTAGVSAPFTAGRAVSARRRACCARRMRCATRGSRAAYGMPRWVAGRVLNCGQSCVGAKRFVVLDKVHDQFVEVSGIYSIIACCNVARTRHCARRSRRPVRRHVRSVATAWRRTSACRTASQPQNGQVTLLQRRRPSHRLDVDSLAAGGLSGASRQHVVLCCNMSYYDSELGCAALSVVLCSNMFYYAAFRRTLFACRHSWRA